MNKSDKLELLVKYFNSSQNERQKAIGLTVILGGVPPRKIGWIDVLNNDGTIEYYYEDLRLQVINPELKTVLDSFAQAHSSSERTPLFKTIRKDVENKRLVDCRTLLFKAGEALGITSKSHRWHQICAVPGIVYPVAWNGNSPDSKYPVLSVPYNEPGKAALIKAYYEGLKAAQANIELANKE